MLSEELIMVFGLFSIVWWPIALILMFLLRNQYPPSNEKNAASRALAYVGIFWVGRTVGNLAGQASVSNGGLDIGAQELGMLLFSLPLALIWIYVAYRRIEHVSWGDLGWNRSNIKRDIVYGVLLGVVLFFLVNFRMTFTSLPTFDFDVGAAVILFVVSFGVASWQEENIYRGHLQPKLELLATPKWRANAIQAILFSIAHIGFWQFTSIATLLFDLAKVALLGFVLGYYRQRYGSLLAPFIAHGLLDFFPIFWQY